MGFYQVIRTQKIPADLDMVWDFISAPENLKKITPASMGFEITSGGNNQKMYEGMIISYRVRPILNINTTWVTEITHIKPQTYFVDEQRVGPYKMWHHEHKIEQIAGGVLMTDIVSYQPPLGWIGSLANTLIIRQKLQAIFDYRTLALEEIFGKWEKSD
ncbi:SRPBCC family protein [Maribellus sediminis]|uniref:SRPBCC family protein n=1 Tax=Maribellus sediminis TaxID=2696285 RepID=UPI00142FB7B8|nr:SRPBCC family protein [Maribellus sediminis]